MKRQALSLMFIAASATLPDSAWAQANKAAAPTPAPAAPSPPGRVGLLAFARGPEGHGYAAVEVLAEDGRLATAAANLFAALRRLDALGLDRLVAEPVPEEGLGRAILDRLRRASTVFRTV